MNKLKEQIDMELNEMRAGSEILEKAKRASGIRIKRSRPAAISVAAALVVILGCVTAGASGIFGHFGDYFNGNTEPYQDQILQSAMLASDDDFAFGMDGVVSDETQCMFVLSVEAKTGKAQKQLSGYLTKHGLPAFSNALKLTAYLKDGTNQSIAGNSVFSYTDLQNDQHQSYMVTVKVRDAGLDTFADAEKIQIEFEGLILNAQLGDLMPEIGLTAAKTADGTITPASNVTLSPIGFSFASGEEEFEIRLIRNDGTLADEDEVSYHFGFSRARVDESAEVQVYGDFRYTIINLDEYSGIRINGVDYLK